MVGKVLATQYDNLDMVCAAAVGRLCRLRSKGHSHFKWREEHAEMIILKERPKIGWGHSRAVLNFAK